MIVTVSLRRGIPSLLALSEGSKPLGRFLLGAASVFVLVYGFQLLKRVGASDRSVVRLFFTMAAITVALVTAFVVLLVFAVVFPKWAPVIAGALFLVHKWGPRIRERS